VSTVSASDWLQWRGPSGNGISTESGLPLKWSATDNVAWTAALGGHGVSTPIVIGDRVIVTSQVGAGVRPPGQSPAARAGRRSRCGW
jgi:hypothetical protein